MEPPTDDDTTPGTPPATPAPHDYSLELRALTETLTAPDPDGVARDRLRQQELEEERAAILGLTRAALGATVQQMRGLARSILTELVQSYGIPGARTAAVFLADQCAELGVHTGCAPGAMVPAFVNHAQLDLLPDAERDIWRDVAGPAALNILSGKLSGNHLRAGSGLAVLDRSPSPDHKPADVAVPLLCLLADYNAALIETAQGQAADALDALEVRAEYTTDLDSTTGPLRSPHFPPVT